MICYRVLELKSFYVGGTSMDYRWKLYDFYLLIVMHCFNSDVRSNVLTTMRTKISSSKFGDICFGVLLL